MPSAIGTIYVDPLKPSISLFVWHDGKGVATFTADLRSLPTAFIGRTFAMQAFTLDANGPIVSAPWVGAIAY